MLSKVSIWQKLIIIGFFEPVVVRNFFDPISKPLFQPACLSDLLFLKFLSYTTDFKIHEFKIMQSKVWWVPWIYWTHPYKGPDNLMDWVICINFFFLTFCNFELFAWWNFLRMRSLQIHLFAWRSFLNLSFKYSN